MGMKFNGILKGTMKISFKMNEILDFNLIVSFDLYDHVLVKMFSQGTHMQFSQRLPWKQWGERLFSSKFSVRLPKWL